jgi:putative pyruvate formate lyase activating enzyme
MKLKRGELEKRIKKLYQILEACQLCPRKCGVNRLKGQRGICQAGEKLMVASYHPHFGEEEVLVGSHGSGTIFLSYCSLRCLYCQNYEISHLGSGREYSELELAEMMLELQARGCHNINFVTPTHFTPQLVKAIKIASQKGLNLPIVWNCGGYENIEIIKLLEGIVDIYMPDMKYGDNEPGKKYSIPPIPDYWDRNREAIKEMHRQVGDLKVDKRGIAKQGLLIRHLVLPDDIAKSENILKFIAKEISKNSYVNIMAQYYPAGLAFKFPELNRPVTEKEFLKVIQIAKKLGLKRGFTPLF